MTHRRGSWLLGALFGALLSAGTLQAQSTASVSGQIKDENGTPIAGAQVSIMRGDNGIRRVTITGDEGRYQLSALRPGGPYQLEVRSLGYGTEVRTIESLTPGASVQVDLVLGSQAVALDAIEVFAERAVERATPVAYSDVPKAQITQQLGSRDIPLILNTTPSVYATAGGGGAGDARINVRGFDQRNVAVMINGVPINDMENGWVYWSNWGGIGDATSSIQLQRGLSAVNLATPSIGGTLNIVTDAAAREAGASVKQEFGSYGFLKTTVTASTGLLDDRFAVMASGVRTTSDGAVTGTWNDAWAGYVAASYLVNDRNRFDFYALAAPQRHGQNLYAQNIAAYSHEFAASLPGYDPEALKKFAEAGRWYNENVSAAPASYTGEQAVGDDRFSRFSPNFINERENFYNKPQVNLNWYSQLTDELLLSTVGYYSGGIGGGTGTYGSMKWDYSGPSRVVDYGATITANQANATGAKGILRNSRNNQNTFGAISKLRWDVSDAVSTEVGVDWRTASVDHYYEVRDLLGGDYYLDKNDEFNPTKKAVLGDHVNYDFTNSIDWLGSYLQGEFNRGPVSVFAMGGISSIQYGSVNHFMKGPDGGELSVEADRTMGYQIKGGGLYNLTSEFDVFANAGYVSKVPNLDGMIDDYAGTVNANPVNEKFVSMEAGVNYRSTAVPLAVRFDVYRTTWADRTNTRSVITADGTEGIINLTGLDQLNQGVELQLSYQPIPLLRLDGSASYGDWRYTRDVTGSYRPDANVTDITEYNFYVDGLRVGDAPQTQFSYTASVYPVKGLTLQAVGMTNMRYYANFDPFSRTTAGDRTQSWRVPDYTLFDLHASYDLPSRYGLDARLFANLFNVFDKLYVQDATDNSSFNGFDMDHDADDAEVYLGAPRTLNVGLSVGF